MSPRAAIWLAGYVSRCRETIEKVCESERASGAGGPLVCRRS
jgi:hypothetical protein